jgi:hypothetical protein
MNIEKNIDRQRKRLQYQHDHREERRVYNIKWRKENSEKWSALSIAQTKKTQERYPERSKARSLVSNALYRGKLQKGDCAYPNGKCNGRIEAHHWDYAKPLEVVWFCKKHHMIADKIKLLINKYNNAIHAQHVAS